MRRKIPLYLPLFSILFLWSCQDENTTGSNSNILLIIADDLGKDAMPGYNEGNTKPNMPVISSLADEGIKFLNLWVAPVCTPTRATILTGKYGIDTGMLQVGDDISISETTLHSELPATYNNALIGKWHLSNSGDDPEKMGIDYYAGLVSGGLPSYTKWTLFKDGQEHQMNEYATTTFTDLAIDWIKDKDDPWFLWLAYNAPHTPFHLPPEDLHSYGTLSGTEEDIQDNPMPYYFAAIEAMDTEIGRLLNSLDETTRENTIIIFIGDNGTPAKVVQNPYSSNKSKGSLYQGGINVPMIVTGPQVTRQGISEDALINSTDLYGTILDLAGKVNNSPVNSRSFKFLLSGEEGEKREFTYSEVSSGNTAGFTIRNERYKLMQLDDSTSEMYDLLADPYETKNLIDQGLTTDQEVVLEILIGKAMDIRE